MTERVMAQVVRWLTVVLAAVGAGIGTAFVTELGFWQRVVVAVVSGLLGVALALVWVGSSEKPAPSSPAQPPPAPPRPAPVPTPTPAPAPAPSPEQGANGQWWQQTGKPAATTKPGAARRESVPLKDFDAHRALIAQCPRCGGFELDVRRDGHACAFACRNPDCRATWEWLPGTAWPATVVRHNLTRAVPADEERR
ncbi:Rcat domain-containing protein [Saccharothrix variisporea]|uniref:Uncharacterized protein n=1 Tax=Saccharothrix variisporea TaxID=543527 RepID=A0A495WZU8_9PSEU|nr:hypothetical protein [Saccharothrix variisporea]RKT66919.1 hypothetical protein DFJ66_0085 [Saccharothrix variisporea]